MTTKVQCARCERVATGPAEIAGSWFAIDGTIVCPTCQTLEDLISVQNERDAQGGPTTCPGCGRTRDVDEFWRGYLLSDEQLERTLAPPRDPEVTLVCPECEHRVLVGLEL